MSASEDARTGHRPAASAPVHSEPRLATAPPPLGAIRYWRVIARGGFRPSGEERALSPHVDGRSIKLARDRDRNCAPCRCRRTRGTGRLGCGRSRPRRGVRRRSWRGGRRDRGLAVGVAQLQKKRRRARRELSGERAIHRRRPADSRCGTQVASCGVRSPTVTGAQSVPGGCPESRTAAPEIAGSTARETCPIIPATTASRLGGQPAK